MAFSFVQDDGSIDAVSPGTGTVLTQVMSLNVTVNNLLVVVSAWETTDTTCTITDSRGATWVEITPATHPTSGTKFHAAHYAIVPSTGACTVTQTLGAARAFRSIIVTEYSGGLTTSAVLGKSTVAASNTSNPTCGPLEVLTSGELAFAASVDFAGATYAAAGGFTERTELAFGAGASDHQTQDLVSPSLGPLTASWTAGADDHVRIFVLFRSQEPASAPQSGTFGDAGAGSAVKLYKAHYKRY